MMHVPNLLLLSTFSILVSCANLGKAPAGEETMPVEEQPTAALETCKDGTGNADVVRIGISNAAAGDSVKGTLKCGGIEVATCTATVGAGATTADCSQTSTSNADGLEKECVTDVLAGDVNTFNYVAYCFPAN